MKSITERSHDNRLESFASLVAVQLLHRCCADAGEAMTHWRSRSEKGRSVSGAQRLTGPHIRSTGQLRYEKSTSEDREFAVWLFVITFMGFIPMTFLAAALLFFD